MTTFLIYIAGFILNYLLVRFYSKVIDGDYWTKDMRLKIIMLSFLSWFCIIIATIRFVREYSNDEPASW